MGLGTYNDRNSRECFRTGFQKSEAVTSLFINGDSIHRGTASSLNARVETSISGINDMAWI